MNIPRKLAGLLMLWTISYSGQAQSTQQVEGFDKIVFHYNANSIRPSRDFRGTTPGYMTAGWWMPGQMKGENKLVWQTDDVPAKKATTFSFIGASAVLPPELSRGPEVKLFVNDKYALTFRIGANRNMNWKEGDYLLAYTSKRVEYPYFSSHRQLELHGNSGVYELTVPASDVEPGKPVNIKVQIMPFEGWTGGWFMVKAYKDVLKDSEQSLKEELESLRQDVNMANVQNQILASQLYSNMLGAKKLRHEVAYENGFRHLHPADIIKLKNGDILMMAREASEHYAPDGDVFMLRSKDGGKTWGEKQWIAKTDVDEREGCGIQLKDGTILVGVFYNDLYNPDGSYKNYFNPQTQAFEEVKRQRNKPALGTFIVTSKDNGRTWSEPYHIDISQMPVTGLEGPTDAPIEMPDGSILMGVIGYGLNKDSKTTGSIMLRSTDKGKTWSYLSTIASDEGDKLGGFVEPGIVRTKTGRIVAALRNKGPENAIWVTYSDDNGKTWVPVYKTDMIGHPTDLIQLADGRLMATYGVRPGPHFKPGGIRACFSSDNGKTWDISTEVQLRNDFINWDIGYPESIQMPDKSIMTVYYYNLFGKYYLGATFWKP
jgi:BNR/Asp-box repeat.